MSFEKDGLDYLLISTTYEMQGTAQYDLQPFMWMMKMEL